jgi:hypothetical protein
MTTLIKLGSKSKVPTITRTNKQLQRNEMNKVPLSSFPFTFLAVRMALMKTC